MIKKFIQRLLGKGETATETPAQATADVTVPAPEIPLGQRVEIPASEHRIDPKLIDEPAVRVVRTLKDAGYTAYIVGGAVRDLLVGLKPKDFDVATDATPEQTKALFRRAFIIGRRFRLVHVVFGRGREHEVIEVSTFRAYLDPSAVEQAPAKLTGSKQELAGKTHVVDAAGRVLRDNVWGPQIEDAARRDFTVNALYYDPSDRIVVDYHGGYADSRARVLRMIGDPETRYREDPVRMIRVVRFAAKLGFAIDPATQAPIRKMVGLLDNVPVSRMFDEMIKLLQTGHALASLAELQKQGLHRGVFPLLDAVLDAAGSQPDEFVRLALADTDRRVAEGRPVAPGFMLACMLWREVLVRWQALRAAGEAPTPALQQAVDAVFDARIGDISARGKLAGDMREIWLMQPRFERRNGQGPYALIDQPRYRAGYDFLRLRADAGEISTELADWWEDFALGSDEEREALLRLARESAVAPAPHAPAANRRSDAPARPPRAKAAGAEGSAVEADAGGRNDEEPEEVADPAESSGSDTAPARKRRRRRRKPAGGTDAGAVAPATPFDPPGSEP